MRVDQKLQTQEPLEGLLVLDYTLFILRKVLRVELVVLALRLLLLPINFLLSRGLWLFKMEF